ncbi:MAG: deoxyribose-phosphate aldolase [Candidatus Kapabacteria bacterium]|nr:deoxyribose-phosphate aldolase [Candidatus Kapabacteria bacterium]
MKKFSKYIDGTILRPDATIRQIRNLCNEALEFDYASVCVNPYFVNLAYKFLKGTPVNTCTVIGFPLGASAIAIKKLEAGLALKEGANELDMVINISALKEKNYNFIEQEISQLVKIAHSGGAILKVIIETCLLSYNEKIEISKIVSSSGADFIKTSTGFSSAGATIDDVELLKTNVSADVKVKASGGIKTYPFAKQLIDAGADRLGTSAGSVIIEEYLRINQQK